MTRLLWWIRTSRRRSSGIPLLVLLAIIGTPVTNGLAEEPAQVPGAEESDAAPESQAAVEPDSELPPGKSLPLAPRSIPDPVVRPALASTVGPNEAEFRAARSINTELAAQRETMSVALHAAGERRIRNDETIKTLEGRLEAVPSQGPEADELHEEIDDRLTLARQELRGALDEVRRPSGLPATLDIEKVSSGRPGPDGDEWTPLVDEITRRKAEAKAIEEQLRWTNVAVAGEAFHRLSALRTISFGKISPEKRELIFGTSRDGLEQLTRELRHLGVAGRYYVMVRAREIRLAPAMMRDYLALGEIIIMLLRVALVLAIALFVRSRWRDWLHGVRGSLFRWFQALNARRRLQRVLGLVEISFPWLLLFLTIELVEWALGVSFLTLEVQLLLSLIYYYGLYRLSIDLVIAGVIRLSTHYELDLSAERTALLRASVVFFFRVVFGLGVLSLVSGRLLGGGYLSQIASRFAGLVIAFTLFALMLRWRRELADAFLSKHSTGPIADLVRRTRDTWLGVLVAPASFLWILGRAAAALARDFAMGFEQTQRALAFLFRRRIEREAERRGYAAGDLESLPDKCRQAFSEDAIERSPGMVDHFPALNDLLSDLSGWRDRGEGRSFLLTGERGVGKTTWLRQVRRDDVRIDRIQLGLRATSRDVLVQRLAERLECPEASFEGLVRHLKEDDRRIVVLDDAQLLFLATVNGYEAWSAFIELINRTKHNVFWVVSMSGYAWNHLKAVRSDWGVFNRHQHLAPWSEERIRELLRARVTASGMHYNFSSLALERLEGVTTRDHLIESAEGYARLIWDYADGNPRVAVHFFLHSLDPVSENRVKVRLFRAPDVGKLVSMGDTALFVLACVVAHESISAPHIVEATRYPAEICRIFVDKFLAEGVVREDDGLYWITTHWQRAVIRTLRRRNVLSV